MMARAKHEKKKTKELNLQNKKLFEQLLFGT